MKQKNVHKVPPELDLKSSCMFKKESHSHNLRGKFSDFAL